MGLWVRTTIPPASEGTRRFLGTLAIMAAVVIAGNIMGLPDYLTGVISGWLGAEFWHGKRLQRDGDG
jgi:hypothetical protein